MLRSIRLRVTLVFIVLLGFFGWVVSLGVSHYIHLNERFDHASQQHHIRFALTVFLLILAPLAAAGIWFLVGRTLSPLRALSRQAESSSSTRLVSPSSDAEMVELVSTINHLLDRVEASASARAQFYAASSHELRTPLQALSGHIETSLSQNRNKEEYRDALIEAQKQTHRLTTLTSDILMLHQLQSQSVSPIESADLVMSIESCLQELTPLIEARGLTVERSVPDTLVVKGKQSYADVCVRNLIENAARYGTTGQPIKIILTSKGLEVHNRCDRPIQDLEKFFEPFAASKGVGSSGGNGLGLAICRAAADANGWNLRLMVENGTVVATLTFQ